MSTIERVRELGDRYRLIASVGRGGSGEVYLAEDTSLRRQVAVKTLHEDLANDDRFLTRFRSEAQSVASLNHPNVMAVHDWGEDDVPFLVMEYLGGGSLRAMLDVDSRLTPSQAIAIGIEACKGLHFAHEAGLVHRDVKPANLMFGHEGRLRIADFGLAHALADADSAAVARLVGTARYASPEQAQGLSIDGKSDVYSLGVTLLEAIAGELPMPRQSAEDTLVWRVENDIEIPDSLPEKLGDALRAMTDRDPAARLSASDAGKALLASAEGLPRPQMLPLVGASAKSLHPSLDDMTVHDDPDATEVARTPTVATRAHEDEPARRWPLIFLVFVGIGVAGWFLYNQTEAAQPSDVEVPAVVGLPLADALTQFGDSWILSEKYDRSPDVDQGAIVRTDPPAGSLLTEGEELRYWVSLGLPLIRVPKDDLIGRSQAQAESTIVAEGLTVGAIERINSEDVGTGLVISVQSEAAELPQGDPVDLVVSLGPEARIIQEPTGDAESYVALLVAAGLGVEQLEDWDPDIPEGGFISIIPEVGTAVEKGETVTVTISMGPEPVPVPASAGRDLGDVLDSLDNLGLLAGALEGSGNAGCPVSGTDPPAGTLLQPGNSVTIFLSECDAP
ncbi:MAG: protein kinase [Acidimicrobiales bacterium]|nr:protein kinase [Acidimicrobiales bacterium]